MTSVFLNNYKNYKTRLTGFDYFYFFVVVIYAAMAVPATKSMMRPEGGGLIAYAIPWGLTLFIVLKHKIQFNNKNLAAVIALFMLWLILQTLKVGIFYAGSIIFLGNILIAYILIKVYDFRMFFLYEKVVTFMAALSIFFWLLQVLIPGPFTAFMMTTSISDFPARHTITANNIFFSLSGHLIGLIEGHSIPRNAGFSWEPGRYASMLVFALFFNIIRKKFDVLKNRSFWILVIALLTTQSTTGYSGLLLVIFMIIFNKNIKVIAFSLPLIVLPIVVGIVFLPFMADKISTFWFNPESLEDIQRRADYYMSVNNDEVKFIPQRFDSIAYHFMNVKDSPLLGYGLDPLNSYVLREISPLISPTGGIIRQFSQFGVLIGILAYFSLYKSSVWFSTFFGYKGEWWLFSLFTLLSVSYSFWIVPIFMSLWMFPLFHSKNR
ncbi:MAG: hypothetical protein ACJA0H_001027 [Francisellaceae bacterium]|jgi:hypothetical protein